jgi:hypothetical protein
VLSFVPVWRRRSVSRHLTSSRHNLELRSGDVATSKKRSRPSGQIGRRDKGKVCPIPSGPWRNPCPSAKFYCSQPMRLSGLAARQPRTNSRLPTLELARFSPN